MHLLFMKYHISNITFYYYLLMSIFNFNYMHNNIKNRTKLVFLKMNFLILTLDAHIIYLFINHEFISNFNGIFLSKTFLLYPYISLTLNFRDV